MDHSSKSELIQTISVEFVRCAMLNRRDLKPQTEEDAAVYAVWYLLNPLKIDGRDRVEQQCRNRSGNPFRFTAHSHADEPAEPSPDDMLLYDLTHGLGKRAVHYIADRFRIRRLL